MYSDTLDMDFSFDVPGRRPALLSRKMFDIPVCPIDAKGLIISIPSPDHCGELQHHGAAHLKFVETRREHVLSSFIRSHNHFQMCM